MLYLNLTHVLFLWRIMFKKVLLQRILKDGLYQVSLPGAKVAESILPIDLENKCF